MPFQEAEEDGQWKEGQPVLNFNAKADELLWIMKTEGLEKIKMKS